MCVNGSLPIVAITLIRTAVILYRGFSKAAESSWCYKVYCRRWQSPSSARDIVFTCSCQSVRAEWRQSGNICSGFILLGRRRTTWQRRELHTAVSSGSIRIQTTGSCGRNWSRRCDRRGCRYLKFSAEKWSVTVKREVFTVTCKLELKLWESEEMDCTVEQVDNLCIPGLSAVLKITYVLYCTDARTLLIVNRTVCSVVTMDQVGYFTGKIWARLLYRSYALNRPNQQCQSVLW